MFIYIYISFSTYTVYTHMHKLYVAWMCDRFTHLRPQLLTLPVPAPLRHAPEPRVRTDWVGSGGIPSGLIPSRCLGYGCAVPVYHLMVKASDDDCWCLRVLPGYHIEEGKRK